MPGKWTFSKYQSAQNRPVNTKVTTSTFTLNLPITPCYGKLCVSVCNCMKIQSLLLVTHILESKDEIYFIFYDFLKICENLWVQSSFPCAGNQIRLAVIFFGSQRVKVKHTHIQHWVALPTKNTILCPPAYTRNIFMAYPLYKKLDQVVF